MTSTWGVQAYPWASSIQVQPLMHSRQLGFRQQGTQVSPTVALTLPARSGQVHCGLQAEPASQGLQDVAPL